MQLKTSQFIFHLVLVYILYQKAACPRGAIAIDCSKALFTPTDTEIRHVKDLTLCQWWQALWRAWI